MTVDLSRRVVKTEWAAIEIPELEFEITKQTGLITTVEGILERAIDGLKHTIKSFTDEDLLLSENVSSRQKLCDFVLKLTHLKEGNESFTFILSDISGNSYVESLCAPPAVDPQVDSTRFIRTIDEDKLLGIYEFGVDNDRTATEETQAVANKLQDEVLRFPTNCPNCSAPAFTNMKVQRMYSVLAITVYCIPHFKEVVIMATNCDACGHKTNEVKSGSGIEDKGICITLKVADESDLERDVVISDTCSLAIPELDIHMSGTGSGRYTTVEGIASTIIDDLKRHNPFVFGDSAKEDVRQRMSDLAAKLESLVGRTLVLNDPCGNSYVSGDGLDVERYERSYDQNEELGLNDIKTENYS
ncbi:unnamed protein product [Medioppia subpectinata]|uniref:Zinc finger ZPR1-type domain-containing protein n=1 Tax=Medioppia subpectinata TaxID=1979941 RepID=A0A7R9L2X5_9ACAR|nr:unnamed protein product [Medioppia subpectinata]CAG2114582.1 unnamed protein product [Medioppia subpectinata]